MLPSASVVMLETSPSFHCGGTLGQVRSTVKVGRLRVCAWAAVCAAAPVAVSAVAPMAAAATNAITTALGLVCFMCSSVFLVFAISVFGVSPGPGGMVAGFARGGKAHGRTSEDFRGLHRPLDAPAVRPPLSCAPRRTGDAQTR